MTIILTCPACQTHYSVKEEAIPAGGRTVKCAKCGNSWHYVHEDAQAASGSATDASPISETTPEPVKPKKSTKAAPPPILAPLWLKLMPIGWGAVLLIVVTIFYYAPLRIHVPFLGTLYDAMGFYSTEGIILKDIAIKKEEVNEKTSLLIQGKLVNTTKEDIRFPSLRIALLDKDKKEIASHVLKSSGKKLEAGGIFPITNKITRLPVDSHYLILDIGNKMDLVLR